MASALRLDGLTANQRAAKLKELRPRLQTLTANLCTCSKERAALNSLSDESLLAIYNAKAEGSNADVIGGTGSDQAGDEEESDDHDFKSRRGKGLDDPNKVGDAHIEAEKPPSMNALRRVFGAAAAGIAEDLAYARNAKQARKAAILEQLTGNARDRASAQRALAVYSRMPLEQLEMLASAMPAPVGNSFEDDGGINFLEYGQRRMPSYQGAGIGMDLTGNTGGSDREEVLTTNEEDAPLVPPTINYQELSAELSANGHKE
jgi:hypothetical protein